MKDYRVQPRIQTRLVKLTLLALPLAIGLAWGPYLDDSAYPVFRSARNLATGRGLAAWGQAPLQAPLYTLALALPGRLGIPLPQAGLVLSALGWGVTALAMYGVAQAMRQPQAALVSAALVTFNPMLVSTLGTEASWATALAWIAIWLALKKQWSLQVGALVLMLLMHFPLPPFPGVRSVPIATWLEESEFYGLFLPWIGLGLLAALSKLRTLPGAPSKRPTGGRRSALGLAAILLWALLVILSGNATGWAMLVTLGLFLTGLGVEWAIDWIDARGLARLSRPALAACVVLVAGLPPAAAQASSLFQRYPFRPSIRQELEQQAGDWLRSHSEPAASVLGSERVGYLADRPGLAWNGREDDQARLANLLQDLSLNPPTYCVSFKSMAWDRLTRTGWFQDGYLPLRKFESPYDSTSPYVIWGYQSSGFDRGERQPMNARLPSQVNWVGYKYWPDRIQPGEAVYVTLFLQAAQPITRSLRTVVRMIAPGAGAGWAQRDVFVPHSVPPDWWQAGQVIAERFILTTTAKIPVGAYRLEISVVTPEARSFMPMYRGDETAPIQHIFIGYVAVPWPGAPDVSRPVNANLGNQISLVGLKAPENISPGAEFDVTLYWEAQRPPDEDYVVFVHLLDANGQFVTGDDGPPMGGRYPTGAWRPGDIVPDVHRLTLDPNIPAGTYRLQAGIYRWPSLERLPVWDSQGVEQADRVIVLQAIRVGP